MLQVRKLERYKDDQGNEIVYDGEIRAEKIDIRFKGSNNRLVISPKADIQDLLVTFTGDNGQIDIEQTTKKRAGLRFELRCGHKSQIRIGENVGCAGRTFISAVEGVSVSIGADVMFAKNIEVRGDDTHPIFDVHTEKRVNPSQSIVVGEHVWIAKHAVVMGGVTIGSGSVIGFRSVVTKSIPNNCTAVGSPARVVRRNIAWERPEVVGRQPNELYPRKGEKSTQYWNPTEDDGGSEKIVVRPKPKGQQQRRLVRFLPTSVRRLARKIRSS
ncbi:acyltransferase [Streptomyces sp. BE230]|uniref:acyltransferase n=1 Tax=Streptomyces sp. BE230 TaxID=3002526 RepID=UPI002ED4A0E6|nr:acyltransferase [Streptomyces sp. BE230]